MALGAGAATLVDPRRLSPRMRRGYRLGLTALSAAGAYQVAAQPQKDEDGGEVVLPPVARGAIAAGVAATVYGSVRLGERLDAASFDWLTRHGVKHPRVVLAVGGAVLTLAMNVLEKRQEKSDAVRADPEDLVQVTPDPLSGQDS